MKFPKNFQSQTSPELIKVRLFLKFHLLSMQKSGRLILWLIILFFKIHFAETQEGFYIDK